MCHTIDSLHWHTIAAQEATNANCLSRGLVQENFFSARVVDKWNSLDEVGVTVETVNGFEGYLDKLGY